MTVNKDDKNGLDATDDPSTNEKAWVIGPTSAVKDFNRNGPASIRVQGVVTSKATVNANIMVYLGQQKLDAGRLAPGMALRIDFPLGVRQKDYMKVKVALENPVNSEPHHCLFSDMGIKFE